MISNVVRELKRKKERKKSKKKKKRKKKQEKVLTVFFTLQENLYTSRGMQLNSN